MAVSEKDRGLIEDYRDAVLDLADWLDGFGTMYHWDRKVVNAAKKLRTLAPSTGSSGLTYLMTDTMAYVDEVVESLYSDDPLYPRMVQDWEEEEDDVLREIHRLSVILPGLGFAAPYAETMDPKYRRTFFEGADEERLEAGLKWLANTGAYCGSVKKKKAISRYGRLGLSLDLKINGDYSNKEKVVSEAIDQGFREFGVRMPNPYEITDRQRWIPQELARIDRLCMALSQSVLPY